MGMFDTILGVPVVCPRCGDSRPKSVQIKCGPQILMDCKFGEDSIDIDWGYGYYGSIRSKKLREILGIAGCKACEKAVSDKMDELVRDHRKRGDIVIPEGAKYLLECRIGERDALGVIMGETRRFFGGVSSYSDFYVTITLDENMVPIKAVQGESPESKS